MSLNHTSAQSISALNTRDRIDLPVMITCVRHVLSMSAQNVNSTNALSTCLLANMDQELLSTRDQTVLILNVLNNLNIPAQTALADLILKDPISSVPTDPHTQDQIFLLLPRDRHLNTSVQTAQILNVPKFLSRPAPIAQSTLVLSTTLLALKSLIVPSTPALSTNLSAQRFLIAPRSNAQISSAQTLLREVVTRPLLRKVVLTLI